MGPDGLGEINSENLTTGYVAVYRSLLEHPLWEQHPPEYLKVWIYCLLKASRKPRRWWDGNAEHQIPVGGFVGSINTISSNCGVSRGQAERALRVFAECAMIVIKPRRKHSLYIVKNFATYQPGNGATETLARHQRDTGETPARHERDQTIGNREKVIGESAERALARLWERHPKKRNRTLAEQALVEAISTSPVAMQELLDEVDTVHAAWCASDEWTKDGGRYAPTLDRWLSIQGWRDGLPVARANGNRKESVDEICARLLREAEAQDAAEAAMQKASA